MTDSERIGPYRVIRRLGAGGMGEVVLAHDERLDRLVAIKRLHANHAATPDRRERFRREARIAARINHPAIVHIHDVLHEGDHDYLIMEYVDGRTLRECCAAGPMTVSEVLGVAHQIALGMAAAHDLDVIHRDLKAENILITPAGRAKITDFGIAKLHGDDTITAEGAVIGTFRAMSPEQALGREVDHRSDLFSFGILLYEALSGISPFRAETSFLTVQRLVADDPQPLAELVPLIPNGLASLIHQLLAKEPLLRPRDFHEVADALIELASHACDEPCHAGASPGHGSPSSGEDTHPPAVPCEITIPSAKIISAPTGTANDAAGANRRVGPRRLRYATAISLAIVGTLGIGYTVRDRGCFHAPPRPPLVRVAVLDPSVSGTDGRPDVALLATSIRTAVMTGVRDRVGLDLVPRADVDSYVDGFRQSNGRPPTQRATRTAVGADEVIAILIECVPSSCKIILERDAGSSSSPPPESFHLDADRAGRPDETVAAHLSRLYPDHPVRAAAAAGSIDPRDHASYVRLVQDYWAEGGIISTDKVLAELENIRKRSPRSLDVLLFEAEVYRHRYLQTDDPDHARRAMALLQGADELSPDTYSILSARFDLALSAGQLDDARAILDRLVLLDPDSSVTHLQHAKLYYQRGDLNLARDELAEAARRDSFSWHVLYHQVLVSRALGDRAAARAAIAELLRRSPDNHAGLSLLAGEERYANRLACAAQIYTRLVAREPLYQECVLLGNTLNQLGRYDEAADSFRRALDVRPADPTTLLDLAESLVLAGNTSGAEAQLRVLQEILDSKRRRSPGGALEGNDLLIEAQTLAYLGRDDPALAAEARARAAELLTPGAQPEALFTAALVHAVLGDRDLAATYVTQYLDGGGSPAQLAYRWFDDLRSDTVLGPRLAIPPVARSCDFSAP
jgi:serine/threonine protein kinase/tetratricopeptide (TPR) repeat protein